MWLDLNEEKNTDTIKIHFSAQYQYLYFHITLPFHILKTYKLQNEKFASNKVNVTFGNWNSVEQIFYHISQFTVLLKKGFSYH